MLSLQIEELDLTKLLNMHQRSLTQEQVLGHQASSDDIILRTVGGDPGKYDADDPKPSLQLSLIEIRP